MWDVVLGEGSGDDMGGLGRGKILIRIYHIKFIFNNIYHTHMHIHIKFVFPTKYFNKTKSNGKDYRRHYRSPGPFEPVSNTVAFVRWPTKLFNTWRTHQISWGGQIQ